MKNKIIITIISLVGLIAGVSPLFMSQKITNQYEAKEEVKAHVEALSTRMHPVGDNELERDYIVSALKEIGGEVTLKPYIITSEDIKVNAEKMFNKTTPELYEAYLTKKGFHDFQPTPIINIEAYFDYSTSDEYIVLMAHYDSKPTSYGAADDGIAVASIMSAVKQLNTSGYQYDIKVLFTDSEEMEMLGAYAHVKYEDLSKAVFVLNFEARGSKGPMILFETSQNNEGIIQAYKDATQTPYAVSLSQSVYGIMPNYTDFSQFNAKQIPGMNFAILGGGYVYHTPLDHPDQLADGLYAEYGQQTYEVIEYVLTHDHNKMKSDREAAYFTPVIGVVLSYPAAYALQFAIFLGAIIVFITYKKIKTQQVSLKELGKAILSLLMAYIAASLIAFICYKLLSFAFDLDSLVSGLYFKHTDIAIITIQVMIMAATGYIQSKIGGMLSQLIITAVWLCILTILLAIYLPQATFIYLVPLAVVSAYLMFYETTKKAISSYIFIYFISLLIIGLGFQTIILLNQAVHIETSYATSLLVLPLFYISTTILLHELKK